MHKANEKEIQSYKENPIFHELYTWKGNELYKLDDDDFDTPSSTRGDYSPSNPWDAPGMSIHDFI